MVYQEGQIVVKRNIYRFILALLIIVITLLIGGIFTFDSFNKAQSGFRYESTITQPTPESIRDALGGWNVPYAPEEIQTLWGKGVLYVLVTGGIIVAAIIFAFKKERYVFRQGKLRSEPEYHLREKVGRGSFFAVITGVLLLIAKFGNWSSYGKVSYTTIAMTFLYAIFLYFVAHRLNVANFKKAVLALLGINVIALVVTAIISPGFNVFDFVISLVIVYLIYGQAGKLDSGSSGTGIAAQ